jgi:hypothetical protein
MAELKTKQNDSDVIEFIKSFADSEQKINDSLELLAMMKETTGYEPKMWGTSIIGFGCYHYKSGKSSQEGDWFMVGFSPRKAAISLYVYSSYAGCSGQKELIEELGKYKMGNSCIYVKKLSDINIEVLKKLIKSTIDYLKSKHSCK